MSATLFVWESANLFVGATANPEYDKSLILETVHIPDMEEYSQTFFAGGAFGGLEIGGLGLKEMTLEFKVAGTDPQTLTQFGLFGVPQTTFTIYRASRNKRDNTISADYAVVRGRLRKITNDQFKRGDLYGVSYIVSEIIYYDLFISGTEMFHYDYLAHEWRVQGVNQFAGANNALGISA
jgi:P2 family phage contractile tail tube protein